MKRLNYYDYTNTAKEIQSLVNSFFDHKWVRQEQSLALIQGHRGETVFKLDLGSLIETNSVDDFNVDRARDLAEWLHDHSMEWHYATCIAEQSMDIRAILIVKIDSPKDAMLVKLAWPSLENPEYVDD